MYINISHKKLCGLFPRIMVTNLKEGIWKPLHMYQIMHCLKMFHLWDIIPVPIAPCIRSSVVSLMYHMYVCACVCIIYVSVFNTMSVSTSLWGLSGQQLLTDNSDDDLRVVPMPSY